MSGDLLDAAPREAGLDRSRDEVVRAGSRTLSLFAYSLNASVLLAHGDAPLHKSELQRKIGWAPPSSLRAAVAHLCDRRVLAKAGASGTPSSAAVLTSAGRALLPVAGSLERWLGQAPHGPIALDSAAARGVIKVLNAGWDSSMVRAIAESALTLDQINAGIPKISYPALKRRLAKLRSTDLVVSTRSDKKKAYAASAWLRGAVVPLATAAHWERRHDIEAQPISAIEVDAAFLLTLPFLRLETRDSGSCTLAVVTSNERPASGKELAGVAVDVEDGKVIACRSSATASRKPATWALGTVDAWLAAVIEGRLDGLRISGADADLVEQLVTGLHRRRFSS